MFEVKVKKTVDVNINIDEAGLTKLVREAILAKDPNILIKDIKFKATRQPAGVSVEVNADYEEGQDTLLESESDEPVNACGDCHKVKCECPTEKPSEVTEEQQELDLDGSGSEDETVEDEPVEEEESFEDREMSLIDEALAEEEVPFETETNLDEPPLEDGLDEVGEEAPLEPELDEPELEEPPLEETAPRKRKSLFAKD